MYAAAQAQAIYATHGHPSEPSSSRPRPGPPPPPWPAHQPIAVSPEQPFQRPRYRPAFPEHSEPDLDPASYGFGGTTFSYAFLPAGPTPDFPGAAAANPSVSDNRSPYPDYISVVRPMASTAAGGSKPLPIKSERLSPAGSLNGGHVLGPTHASPYTGWSSSGPASAPPKPSADDVDVQGWSGPSPNSATSSTNGSSARPSLGPKQSSNEESVSSAGADGEQADGGGIEDGQSEIKHRRRTTRVQLEMLEDTFVVNPKPTAVERKELGGKLDMSPRAVQVWFQNRRAKLKNMAKKAAENGDPPPTLANTRTYSSSGTTASRARAAAAAASAAASTGLSSTPPAVIPASTTPTSSPSATERSSVSLAASYLGGPHAPAYGPAPPLPSYPTYPPPHRGQTSSYQHSPLNQPPQSLGYGAYPSGSQAGYTGSHALGSGQGPSRLSAAATGGVGPERTARRRGSSDHSAIGSVGRRGSVPYMMPPADLSSPADDFDADGPRLAHTTSGGARLGAPYGRQQPGVAAYHQARRGSVPLLQFGNLQLVSEGPLSAHHSPSNTGRFGPSSSYGRPQPTFETHQTGRRGSLPNYNAPLPENAAYDAGQLDIPPYYGGHVGQSPHGVSLPRPSQPSALPVHYSDELPEETFSYGDDVEPSGQGSDGRYADISNGGGLQYAADGPYDGRFPVDPFAPAQEYYPQQPEVVFELVSFDLS